MTCFAAQLTAALKKAGMSKSELARRIPCRRSHVSNWCMGRNYPLPHHLDRINIILGTKLTIARKVTADDVASALGMCRYTLYRAIREGKTDLGFATPSRNGKRLCYRFYPGVVAAKLGI